jgi:HSP20 family protein
MFSLMPWRKERKEHGRLAPWAEHPLGLFRSDWDDLFGRMIARWAPLLGDGWLSDRYGLTIEEKDDAVLVRADAPGFEPGDFDVRVDGDVVTIVAERKTAEAEGKLPILERRLEREFTLPVKVYPEKVEAKYHNGVLELRLIRTEPVKHHKIEVKAA